MIKLGAAIITLLLMTACGGGGGGGGGTNSSATNSSSTGNGSSTAAVSCNVNVGGAISFPNNTSHKVGQSCLTCHFAGGSATPMTVAGTVFKSGGNTGQPNLKVRLYAHNSNQVVATLTTDKCGNFYTTTTVPGLFVAGGPPVNGVDPVVEDSAGGLHTMPGQITNGGCNGCHGSGGQSKIIAN